jgi:trehalose/maltose hydrolase-like predicted phosphorylase
MKSISAIAFLALCVVGCNGPSKSPEDRRVQSQKADPWKLICVDGAAKEPAVLWNGLIGLRIGRDGTGDGQPAFSIDGYEVSGEEKILTQTSALAGTLTLNGQPLAIDLEKPYNQTLDRASGTLTTTYETEMGLKVKAEAIVHPNDRIVGGRWTISGPDANKVGLTSGKPIKDSDIESAIGENSGVLTIDRVVSLAPSRNEPQLIAARGGIPKTIARPRPKEAPTFDELLTQTKTIWKARWQTDIEIEGPVEDQQAIRSFMFYLWGSVNPKGNMSVSPMGLSNTQYNGHVFWDADIWVAPALAFFDPEGARTIATYRLELVSAAGRNLTDWSKAGRPTGNKPVNGGGNDDTLRHLGLKFPWESSVSGKETVPGPSKFEDHISGTVAWSLAHAANLGLIRENQASEVVNGVGLFYDARSEKGKDGLLHINGTMSPDEHHTGDDDLYTNLLAMWTTSGGKWPAKPTFYLPKDNESFLTYQNDNLKGYKQAAAVLSIFPLQYPPAESQAKVMMDRFADKAIKNGPAMSDSVHATIWARIGETQKAYDEWHESWKPFTKSPLLLFSEKRSSAKTYFTTGAAGSLNAVIYGFLGFRLDSEQESGAAWSKKLNGGSYLSIKPNLPPAWKSVKFKNFQLLGKSYTLTATPTTTQVDQGD